MISCQSNLTSIRHPNFCQKRQKEFDMNETCMNHALNMPNIGGCPYCRIDELERMLGMKQEDWISACNEVQVLEQQLAKANKELALSIKERIELGGKLSRYQGEVEVDGYRHCKHCGDLQDISSECQNCDTEDPPQQVRVLVIPKEVE